MAFFKKNTKKIIQNPTSFFHNGTSFVGKITFSEPVAVRGAVSGTIESDSLLYVDTEGKLDADIKVHTLMVKGKVNGDIQATDTVELLESCEVRANITTNKLKMSDGVIFEGHCECKSAH